MGDELTLLLEVFHKIEKAGGQASLSVTTVGGNTKMKLEIATTPVPPTESSSTSSPTGRRHRRRGPRARARRNQRAAAHQAALAEAATSAPLEEPPSRPPLQLLPSPPADSGRRKVISVEKLDVPTFSSINMDGSSSPPPSSPTPSPTTPTPTPSSRRPPLCHLNYDHTHCEHCGRCVYLCVEHHGCYCGKPWSDQWCDVCYCELVVRYTNPKEDAQEQWALHYDVSNM